MKKLALISKILIAILLTGVPAAAAENYYTVRKDDNLSIIGKKHGLKYQSIIVANNLKDSTIYPGQKLVMPPLDSDKVYYVRKGDNLYRISRNHGLKVEEIMAANDLQSPHIKPGERLWLPRGDNEETVQDKGLVSTAFAGGTNGARYSDEDVTVLAKLIHAEARGEDYMGQVAVGAVIVNRIASGKFPANIRDVIYQRTNGVYQFTPVQDGNINREPDEDAFRAAKEALNGADPTNGALFFYNPKKSSDRWIRTLPVTTRIGNHVFAR